MTRGFFAIGIYHTKTEANVGTLWRHAHMFGAAYVFTIGRRYRRQSSDTTNTPLHIPLFHYESIDEIALPSGALLIGVELDATARPLSTYGHPICGVYLLGAEDHGLPPSILERCHSLVRTIIMYDRHVRGISRSQDLRAA